MADIYRRLEEVGLDRKYVTRVALPRGWKDTRAKDDSGRDRAEKALSASLGLDPALLAAPDGVLNLNRSVPKLPEDADPARVLPTVLLARRLMRLAFDGSKLRDPWLEDLSSEALRGFVIAEHRVVRLQSLAETCWGLGVPVLSAAALPAKAIPIDGALLREPDGRAAIVLSPSRREAPAFMTWQLALLIGELHAGATETVLVDATHPDRNRVSEAAWTYAQALVCGPDAQPLEASHRITGVKLASLARPASRELGIDAGVLLAQFALRAARSGEKAHGPALRALRDMGVETGGHGLIGSVAATRIDLDHLGPDAARFLRHVMTLPAL